MTQYRQILRLHSQGISQRSIAQSCGCSRNTVAAVLQRASAANLTWPLDAETDADLERLLFPEKQEQVSLRRMPDFEKVSQRAGPERCNAQAALDGVLRGMPPVGRAALHVLPVLFPLSEVC